MGGKADLALATDVINRRQVPRLTETISELIPAGVVAVLGLSYKPHTPVIEESQGIMLAKALADEGFEVVAHDPMAIGPARVGARRHRDGWRPRRKEAVSQADVVAIVTPWAEYAAISPEWVANGRTRFIIDCWRQLDPAQFPQRLQDCALGAPGDNFGCCQAGRGGMSGDDGRSSRPRMNFLSPYGHEFVRVASLRAGRRGRRSRVQCRADARFGASRRCAEIALMIFPELGISAYAIDDLLFQDALLDRVEAAHR